VTTTEEFRVLAQEITCHMGKGWSLTSVERDPDAQKLSHMDGREVLLRHDKDEDRVLAYGILPKTNIRVRHVKTSAAIRRGASQIAKQINGARFMALYAPEYTRISADNERRGRQKAACKSAVELLNKYIPERDGELWKPTIEANPASKRGPDGKWELTGDVAVDVQFRALTVPQAEAVLAAFARTFGDT